MMRRVEETPNYAARESAPVTRYSDPLAPQKVNSALSRLISEDHSYQTQCVEAFKDNDVIRQNELR